MLLEGMWHTTKMPMTDAERQVCVCVCVCLCACISTHSLFPSPFFAAPTLNFYILTYTHTQQPYIDIAAQDVQRYERETQEAMQEASAAADQAAAALLAELEAEEVAKATIKTNNNSSKKKKKKKNRKVAGGEGRKGGNSSTDSTKQEEEVVVEEAGQLASALAASSITGATAAAAGAAAAAGDEKAADNEQAKDKDDKDDDDDDDGIDNAFSFDDFLQEGAPKTLTCPISHALFRHPVTAQDTYTYERENLEEWIATCAKKGNPLRSPVTNALMEPGFVTSQITRTMTLEYIEGKTKEWQETGGGKRKG
jgi:hypothetical protein